MPLNEECLQAQLERRRPGQSALVTQRQEEDRAELLSGVFEGRTTGTPIAVLVRNTDQRSRDYGNLVHAFRPGHADYGYFAKYGHRDYRGGGRSSARETLARVIAGAIAREFLSYKGVAIGGFTTQVGEVVLNPCVPEWAVTRRDQIEANPVRCPDPEVAATMEALIHRVRKEKDSLGGKAMLCATGVPAGLGEPVFDKLKADLAKAMFSIPAVVALSFGDGAQAAGARGSEYNDPWMIQESRLETLTNHHGGVLGGISTGMPLVLAVTVKPTSSIPRNQETVTDTMEPITLQVRGRHDPCLLPRFVPVGEAMIAMVLMDHFLRWRAQCPNQMDKRHLLDDF
jgi:chorismate synthase